jgi:hypothetical protein
MEIMYVAMIKHMPACCGNGILLRRVAIVRTDVLEEPSASIINVTRIGELRTTLAVISNRRTLRRNTTYYIVHTN